MLRLYKLWLLDEEYFRKEVSYLKYMLVPIQYHGGEGWLISIVAIPFIQKKSYNRKLIHITLWI